MDDAAAPPKSDAPLVRPGLVRLLAVAALLAACAIIGADWFAHTRQAGVANLEGQQLGRDFVNHWAGGRLAAEGRAALAYDIDWYVAYCRQLTVPNAELKWFGYAPTAMLLALPIGVLPFVPALIVWTLAGLALTVLLMRRQLGWGGALVAAVAAPAAIANIIAGQNGAFVAALFAGGVALTQRRPILAGVLFGLLTYKPHLGLLIPVALLAAGSWRSIAAAAATAVGLVAVSGLALGWDAWSGFFADAHIHRSLLEANPGMWPRMPTAYLAGRWLGVPSLAAYIAQGVCAVLAAGIVAVVWRRRDAPLAVRGFVLMVGAFLATPYAWDYDMIVLVVAAVWYGRHAQAEGWKPFERPVLAALVLMPLVTPWLALYAHLQIAPLIYAAALAIGARRALQPATQPRP